MSMRGSAVPGGTGGVGSPDPGGGGGDSSPEDGGGGGGLWLLPPPPPPVPLPLPGGGGSGAGCGSPSGLHVTSGGSGTHVVGLKICAAPPTALAFALPL